MGKQGKHLKRLRAPKSWMLDKLSGIYAPRPSAGPHRLRECIPLVVLLRNRLRYAITYREAVMIVMQRLVSVDGKVRTDPCYPVGLMDVVTIEKARKSWRLIYDTKGRFSLVRLGGRAGKKGDKTNNSEKNAENNDKNTKLCQVRKIMTVSDGIRAAITHDGRTVRYINPDIRVHDTICINVNDQKVLSKYNFHVGSPVIVIGGHNVGRVGKIVDVIKFPGSHDMIALKDNAGEAFTTRMENVFVIGDKSNIAVTLPKCKGIRKSIVQDRKDRLVVKHKKGVA